MTDVPPQNRPTEPPRPRPRPTARHVYNMATDLGTGANIRLKDNLYQAVAILACLIVGGCIGLLVMSEKAAGLVIGSFIGLVVGLLGSGMFLMVYRMIKHTLGEHD